MDLQPTLINNLVRIRPMTSDDLEPLYTIARDPLIWDQHPVKRYQRAVFENFFKESLESGGALIIHDNVTNEMIGSSRFNPIDGFPDGVEIGWSFLARDYWGGIYNRSVKQLMMDHAFQFVNHVLFYIAQNNIRSQKAVEKIGGQKLSNNEGLKIPRKNKDTLIYHINKNRQVNPG